MHSVPHIRTYQAGDAADLAKLLTLLGYPTDDADEIRNRIARMSSDHHTLVAEHDGQVAGFIGLMSFQAYEHPAPIGYILAFSISSAHQRQGIGKALLSAAEEYFLQASSISGRIAASIGRTRINSTKPWASPRPATASGKSSNRGGHSGSAAALDCVA